MWSVEYCVDYRDEDGIGQKVWANYADAVQGRAELMEFALEVGPVRVHMDVEVVNHFTTDYRGYPI